MWSLPRSGKILHSLYASVNYPGRWNAESMHMWYLYVWNPSINALPKVGFSEGRRLSGSWPPTKSKGDIVRLRSWRSSLIQNQQWLSLCVLTCQGRIVTFSFGLTEEPWSRKLSTKTLHLFLMVSPIILRVCREISVSSVGFKHKSKSYKMAIKIPTEDYVFSQLFLMNHFFWLACTFCESAK